jgi:hypothetical protein
VQITKNVTHASGQLHTPATLEGEDATELDLVSVEPSKRSGSQSDHFEPL